MVIIYKLNPMNILKQAPTFLLAFVFVVFGANYFFNFMPMPETTGNVKAFFDVFYLNHCSYAVLLVQQKTLYF